MLTRLLYNKKAVELALIDALIIRSSGSSQTPAAAYFWAYELYYSGYVADLIALLWQIYYDYYIIQYPTLEEYLKTYLEPEYFAATPKAVGVILRNMLNNTPSPDVAMLVAGYYGGGGANSPPAAAPFYRAIEIIAHHTTDQAIDAVIAFTEVADHLADEFRTHVKHHQLSPVLGIKRILFAACAIFEYEYRLQLPTDDDFIFIKSYNESHKYIYDFSTADRPTDILKMWRSGGGDGDMQRCSGLVRAGVDAFACHPDWVTACAAAPFWRDRITQCGGIVSVAADAATVEWVTEDAESMFVQKWDMDPADQPAAIIAMASIHKLVIPEGGENAHYVALFDALRETAALPFHELVRIPRPALVFTPPRGSSADTDTTKSALEPIITAILGEKHRAELGWYMQILGRCEFTPESFAGVKYKGLKKFVAERVTASAR